MRRTYYHRQHSSDYPTLAFDAGGISGDEALPVNILNLPGLSELDFEETDDEYHVKRHQSEIVRQCPNCDRSYNIVSHAWRTLDIRNIPSHGKVVAIHLDVSCLKCQP